MKTNWGLAAAGLVSRSFVARIPKLARQLGPVSSTSYRLASRISNTIKAGTPVRSFADLQSCGILLLSFPGRSSIPLANLDAFDWRRKIVLCCDTLDDPCFVAELRRRGAAVADLSSIPGLPDRYAVVGDNAAVRFAKSLVRSLHGRPLEVPREQLALFQAALTLSGSFFTPLLETAMECLRQSGVEESEAATLAESLFQHSLRSFKHAGRKSWSGAIALADDEAIAVQEQALQAKKPLMGAYFRDAARHSFDLYQTFPELTRYNKERWGEFRKRYQPF